MSELTKRKIIMDTARILFYEQGYKNTYFEQIAEKCNVSKTLISYHFNSKAALAREVHQTYVSDVKNVVSFKVYQYYFNMKSYDLQVSTAVEIRLAHMMYLKDDNVFRFAKERADDKYDDFHPAHNEARYEIHDRHKKLNVDEKSDELKMISNAVPAANFAVIRSFKAGIYNATVEQCLDFCVSTCFRLMKINEERINEIIEESKLIIETVKFEIQPYFRVI